MNADIKHCASMIAQERRLARSAPSLEVAEVHYQLMSLYRAQLGTLYRGVRVARVSSADIWFQGP